MASAGRCDAVLIVGFGGPTRSEEIRPFLDNVLRGRPVPRERYEEVVHHYELLGGRSPYNELTFRQADALRTELARGGSALPVEVGMRNWEPYVVDALVGLARAGVRRALGFIMAGYRSEASWERYQATVRAAREAIGPSAPEVEYPEPWHAHPKFIAATAARTSEALGRLAAGDRARAKLVFTAHSIPIAMAKESPYVEQLTESCGLVASKLGVGSWTLAFQSRSGSPRDPWLEPDIAGTLQKLGKGAIAVVMPIGFLTDHVEVLYDLDIEAARIAAESGVRMERAPTVGNHPEFIAMISEIVRGHLTD
ncbi:MAG TPA: ferrochelatase [Candidatus Binataceae bacterium]|nr:ferrochelatase [Candidatus Binataceae bacterium]